MKVLFESNHFTIQYIQLLVLQSFRDIWIEYIKTLLWYQMIQPRIDRVLLLYQIIVGLTRESIGTSSIIRIRRVRTPTNLRNKHTFIWTSIPRTERFWNSPMAKTTWVTIDTGIECQYLMHSWGIRNWEGKMLWKIQDRIFPYNKRKYDEINDKPIPQSI